MSYIINEGLYNSWSKMILQYIVLGSSDLPVAVSLGVKRIMGHRPVAAAGVRTWDLFVAGGELAT